MTIQPRVLTQLMIFDIDGVLTDPQSKKAENKNLLSSLSNLSRKMPIIFNTGRSAEWVCKNILPHLVLDDYHNNFYAACEMGAVSLTINDSKIAQVVINEDSLAQQVPDQLKNSIHDMVAKNYESSMFVDNTKKVIMTVEMQDNYPIEKYEIDKNELKNSIDIILKHYHPNIHIKPSSSTIAIDIKPFHLNKAYGAKMINLWLKNNDFIIDDAHIHCIGDSASDIEMSDYFFDQQIKTSFIYVGEEKLSVTKPYEIVKSKLSHTDGTYSYLKTVV